MAITQAITNSFKSELMGGEHDLDTDTLKVALYTDSANLDATTTAYTGTGEVANGNGYATGGKELQNVSLTLLGTTAFLDFDDLTWTAATFTARGALIYNSSNANKAIMVIDFGADRSADNGPFLFQVPAGDASNAILRATN